MPRIKKRGLDYFPLNTDFIYDRLVRRVMKHEGDAALAVLVEVLSCIYAGEGYYVRADELFYEDMSAGLFEKNADDVKRIITLTAEYGLFDAALFKGCGVLTSADIQRQYLFSTRRRSISEVDPRYCLLEAEERKCASEGINVTLMPENVTSGTQSTAQDSKAEHSVAENRKENPPHSSPTGEAGKEIEEEGQEEEISTKMQEEKCTDEQEKYAAGNKKNTGRQRKNTALRKEWTDETISQLQPPDDGLKRNFIGLVENLRQCHVPPTEQYAIICKSNFGIIGHPVWKGFYTLRDSHGKIRMPGRYLLSLFNKP